MYIYKTTNLVNGKIYVGKCENVPEKTNWYLGSGDLLQKAFKKYGKENFKKEILEICDTKEKLNEREIFWIKKLKLPNFKIGYNITTGGTGGDTISNHPNKDELLKIWSLNTTKNNKNRDSIVYIKSIETRKRNNKNSHTEESKKKLSISHTGKKHTEETKKKIGELSKGNQYALGSKRTEEQKIEMSKQRKGIVKSEEHKKKISESNKGKKISKESIQKGLETKKRNGTNVCKEETKTKIRKSIIALQEEYPELKPPSFKGKTHTKETKEFLSKQKSGEKNPMYGRTFFEIWVEKYGIEEAQKRQQQRSEKIANSKIKKK